MRVLQRDAVVDIVEETLVGFEDCFQFGMELLVEAGLGLTAEGIRRTLKFIEWNRWEFLKAFEQHLEFSTLGESERLDALSFRL